MAGRVLFFAIEDLSKFCESFARAHFQHGPQLVKYRIELDETDQCALRPLWMQPKFA
jgi:hypothetical protein